MTKFHHPKKLPPSLNPQKFYLELTEAALELGNLNGLQKNLPDPKILIAPLLIKEATVSSKIEGTQSTVSDVLEYEATGKPRHKDTIEVSNYKKAMLMAIEELKKRPLDVSFIKTLHQFLLEKSRGEEVKGKFRNDRVWIGIEKAPIEKASYIPPEHFLIEEYMENLEQYILSKDNEHPLVKIGIIHYQFEAIHPFFDGNGRLGRLLIPLYLYWKEVLFQPILYISGYFEKYRSEYLNKLNGVDKTGEYENWLKFFLASVRNQAKETQDLINQILNLKGKVEIKVERIKSPYLEKIINTIFSKPILKSTDVKIESPTSRRLLRKFTELGILKSLKIKGVKGKVYIFEDLVNLLSY